MAAVDAVMAGPMVWGFSDCCMSACDVFLRLHGIDPMAPLRGLYTNEAEARALIRARGGWRRMTTWLAAGAGLHKGCAAAGEIGLVRGDLGLSLAIGLGRDRWVGRIDGGYATKKGAVLSWRN